VVWILGRGSSGGWAVESQRSIGPLSDVNGP
jgi:hypothetical protein